MGGVSHLNHCQDLLPLIHVIFSFSFTGIIIHSRSSSSGCGKLLVLEQKAAPETADAAFPNAQVQLREQPKWRLAGPESKAVPESCNHYLPKQRPRRKWDAQWCRAHCTWWWGSQTDRQRLRKIPQPRAIKVDSDAKEETTRQGSKRRQRVCNKTCVHQRKWSLSMESSRKWGLGRGGGSASWSVFCSRGGPEFDTQRGHQVLPTSTCSAISSGPGVFFWLPLVSAPVCVYTQIQNHN